MKCNGRFYDPVTGRGTDGTKRSNFRRSYAESLGLEKNPASECPPVVLSDVVSHIGVSVNGVEGLERFVLRSADGSREWRLSDAETLRIVKDKPCWLKLSNL